MKIDVEDFYKRYAPFVYRRCRWLLNDEEEALDALQEVFVKVLINKKQLQNRYPSGLLFRISTNVCLNIKRKKSNFQNINKNDALMRIAEFDEREKRIIISDLLERLFKKEKSSTREIAVMHFVDGMTLKEVSEEVGLSLSGVRRRLRELKKSIEQKKRIYNE